MKLNIRTPVGAVIDVEDHNLRVGSGIIDRKGEELFEGDKVRQDDSLYQVKFLNGSFYTIGDGFGIPLSDLYMKCERI